MYKDKNGVTLIVRVTPRSSQNKILGWAGEALKIALTAPPVEGAANQALIAFLAQQCGLKPRDITIINGHTARLKRVHLAGITLHQAQQSLTPNT